MVLKTGEPPKMVGVLLVSLTSPKKGSPPKRHTHDPAAGKPRVSCRLNEDKHITDNEAGDKGRWKFFATFPNSPTLVLETNMNFGPHHFVFGWQGFPGLMYRQHIGRNLTDVLTYPGCVPRKK